MGSDSPRVDVREVEFRAPKQRRAGIPGSDHRSRGRGAYTWAGFKPEIERAYQALRDTLEVAGLERIGLRYLNRVDIDTPSDRVKLNHFFEFRPFLGDRLPRHMTSFLVGCSLPFFDEQDLCKVELSSTMATDPSASSFVLDLDYFLNEPQSVSPDEALVWIESAHGNLEEVFEGCISDRLRQLFGEA